MTFFTISSLYLCQQDHGILGPSSHSSSLDNVSLLSIHIFIFYPSTNHIQMSLKPAVQVSTFANLPHEVKLLIFDELAPNDRIALALSCKNMMQMHDLNPLEVPKFNSHCAPWNASLKWQYDGSYLPTCRCGGLESLLLQCCPQLPTGRPAWSRQLCVDCQKWLPRRVSYWKEKADTFRNDFWDAHHDAEWMKATELFSKNRKRQCPKCYFIEQGADNDIISIWKDKERRTKMKDIEKRRAPVARRLDWTL